MIQILRHGKQIYTIECKTCGCLFKCTQDDITDVNSSNGDYVSINCPDCGTRITAWSSKDWLKRVLND